MSPQYSPQELRTIQESLPQPTTEITWSVLSLVFVMVPVSQFNNGPASMPHAMGPRLKISFIIASFPEMEPYSATVTLGYWLKPVQDPPSLSKLPHVRATLAALHVVSTWPQ